MNISDLIKNKSARDQAWLEERRAERASRQKAILRYVTPPTAEQLGQIREFFHL